MRAHVRARYAYAFPYVRRTGKPLCLKSSALTHRAPRYIHRVASVNAANACVPEVDMHFLYFVRVTRACAPGTCRVRSLTSRSGGRAQSDTHVSHGRPVCPVRARADARSICAGGRATRRSRARFAPTLTRSLPPCSGRYTCPAQGERVRMCISPWTCVYPLLTPYWTYAYPNAQVLRRGVPQRYHAASHDRHGLRVCDAVRRRARAPACRDAPPRGAITRVPGTRFFYLIRFDLILI